MRGTFFIVGTPIGNLQDLTFRALETLKKVDVVFCEDTRRSLKLLNAYEIRKPLYSCPQFKEKKELKRILSYLEEEKSVAFMTDAGMPALSDPGAYLVGSIRKTGFKVEVIGGVSSLSYFISMLGEEISEFEFGGFLPHRAKDRERWILEQKKIPRIFFESPHRMESTLNIFQKLAPLARLSFAKEISKISESFYEGTASEILSQIKSFKGEWIGCSWGSAC